MEVLYSKNQSQDTTIKQSHPMSMETAWNRDGNNANNSHGDRYVIITIVTAVSWHGHCDGDRIDMVVVVVVVCLLFVWWYPVSITIYPMDTSSCGMCICCMFVCFSCVVLMWKRDNDINHRSSLFFGYLFDCLVFLFICCECGCVYNGIDLNSYFIKTITELK